MSASRARAEPAPNDPETASPLGGREIPVAADPFVGRGLELAELEAALGRTRLITLTGPSGVGKTRLSRELATRVASAYPDGARLIELEAITDPELVPRAVAGALSLWERPGRDPVDTLIASLRRRRLLLLMDNCEHLVQACASLVDTLLGACPGLTVLATSQAVLGIGGEWVRPVAPLPVPEAAAGEEELAASDAVSLFCTRAVASSPRFSPTAETLAAAGDVCRLLDGIPLAIELAAARVAVLSPSQLAERMDERFTLLTGGSRAVMRRHRTLELALDWSHNLLSDGERVLLRRLSVFAGGCALEAVEAVCADESGPPVLDPLAGLVANSLVIADTSGSRARYRLLETVRLYAAKRLAEAGEEDGIRRRHAEWCLALAETAEPALTGPDQVAWLSRLDMEHANLRAALPWAVTTGSAPVALRLASALGLFWRIRGLVREGADRLEAALGLDPEQPPALRARALWGLGFMRLMLQDIDATTAALEESLALAREVGDGRIQARVLLLLGNARLDGPGALDLLGQSAEQARATDDSWCLAHALALIGRVRMDHGDAAGARPPLEECLVVARAARDAQSLRIGLAVLGELTLVQGAYGEAEALLAEGLAVSRQLGEPFAISFMSAGLGEVAAARGDHERAEELLEAALRIDRESGVPLSVALDLCRLGSLALSRARAADAEALFAEATAVLADSGGHIAETLHGLGEVALARGDLAAARGHLVEALALARSRGSRRLTASALASLGRLARAQEDLPRAVSLHSEALQLSLEGGYAPDAVDALEEIAALAAALDRGDRAARLLAAAERLRARLGCARAPARQPQHDADVAAARESLGGHWDEAWSEGASLSLDEAAGYALKGWGPRVRGRSGWASLSRAERQVVDLVAEGLTNIEIGRRLFISPRTVETHLTHIFTKLEMTSRRDLARAAARQRAAAAPASRG